MKKEYRSSADYIEPIVINGLKGRILHIPVKSKRIKPKTEILLVYGHHSSLERMTGIAEVFAKYGNVTMPDLPGFGGMDSLYKIGKKPTLDNLADYLATFIKLQYKRKKIVIGGMSFGLVIVTKMLQKYPELTKNVVLLISLVGFAHKEDFKFKKRTWYLFRYGSSVCSTKTISFLAKTLILRKYFIKLAYLWVANKNVKMKDADKIERNQRINFEIVLWQTNDIRTYMDTTVTMMTLDLTNKKINLPLLHISVEADQYFFANKVRKNLRKIYKKVTVYKAKLPQHAPTVISDAKSASKLIPVDIKKELLKATKHL